MLRQLLKEKTDQEHRSLEKMLIKRIRVVKTLEDYARFLRLLYGFHATVEFAAGPYLQSIGKLQFHKRRKAALLLKGIEKLSSSGEFFTPASMPLIHSVHAALGCWYVLEGSSRGGPYIAQMLKKQLPFLKQEHLHFFNHYGEQADVMWDEFVQVLDQPCTAEETHEATVAAIGTFVNFNSWIGRHAA